MDEERHFLYLVSSQSDISLFHLGLDGQSHPKKLIQKNLRTLMKDQDESLSLSVVGLSVVPKVRSLAQLELILSDGRRVYLSVEEKKSLAFRLGLTRAKSTPTQDFKIVHIISAPPVLREASEMSEVPTGVPKASNEPVVDQGSELKSTNGPLVSVAYSSGGLMAMASKTSKSEGKSELLILLNDSSLKEGADLWNPSLSDYGEMVNRIVLSGNVLSVWEVFPSREKLTRAEKVLDPLGWKEDYFQWTLEAKANQLWSFGAMKTAFFLPRRVLKVVTTRGVSTVIVKRAVDLLAENLHHSESLSPMKAFMERFGALETTAMAHQLASQLVDLPESIFQSPQPQSLASEKWEIVKRRALLVARHPDVMGKGRPILGKAQREMEDIPSEGERGILLTVARLLHCVWTKKLVKFRKEGNEVRQSNFWSMDNRMKLGPQEGVEDIKFVLSISLLHSLVLWSIFTEFLGPVFLVLYWRPSVKM